MKMVAAAMLVLLSATVAYAGPPKETVFLARFDGAWSGSGTVQKDAGSDPWNVACNAIGRLDNNHISIKGACTAAMIVSRAIQADLTYNPATNTYSGVYIGAKSGPARLYGKRVGDRIDLTITWAAPINGDTKARMTIYNEGSGSLRIVVSDQVGPGGPVKATSMIRFRQG
jgi:hypothetical protein